MTGGRVRSFTPCSFVACLLGFAACAKFEAAPESPAEAGAPDAAVTEAGLDAASPACDPAKAFDPPRLVEGLDIGPDQADIRLSADERDAFFVAQYADAGNVADIFRASRATTQEPFSGATLVAELSSPNSEDSPAVSGDLLSIVFSSGRSGNNDLWFASRPSTIAAWGAPSPIPIASSKAGENDAFLSADGEELWFTSQRTGDDDIYVSKKVGNSFGEPKRVEELSSPASDQAPVLSHDGLVVYWQSQRNEDGAASGKGDVFVATRASRTDAFSGRRRVTELDTAFKEKPNWLSTDRCRLYFHSDRTGTTHVYVAERSPR